MVYITVEDENEKPVFINQPYSGEIVENKPPEIPIGLVTAEDKDFGGSQTITLVFHELVLML